MNIKKVHPWVLRELRGAGKNTWGLDTPYVATPHRFVNAILFRLRPLAGLLTCGVWCDRLVIWIPLLDMAARLLRDAVGGRI